MHALIRQGTQDIAAVAYANRNAHSAARSLLALAFARSRRIRSAPVMAFSPSGGRPSGFVTSTFVTGGFVTFCFVTWAESAIPRPVCQSHNHGVRATM